MTFLNSKLGPETTLLFYASEAWSVCAIQDLPKNVSRFVKIIHSANGFKPSVEPKFLHFCAYLMICQNEACFESLKNHHICPTFWQKMKNGPVQLA